MELWFTVQNVPSFVQPTSTKLCEGLALEIDKRLTSRCVDSVFLVWGLNDVIAVGRVITLKATGLWKLKVLLVL